MRLTVTWAIAAGLAAVFVLLSSGQTGGSAKHKAVMMTHLYTGQTARHTTKKWRLSLAQAAGTRSSS